MATHDETESSSETCDPEERCPPIRLVRSGKVKADLCLFHRESSPPHCVSMRMPAIANGNADACLRELTTPIDALRIVLSIVLDRNVAAQCLGGDSEDCFSRWPSSLYGILAGEAVRSRAVWERCSRQIECALGELGKRFASLPPSSLTRLFGEGAPLLTNRELAALLWTLLNQRESMRELKLERADREPVANDYSEPVLAAHRQ